MDHNAILLLDHNLRYLCPCPAPTSLSFECRCKLVVQADHYLQLVYCIRHVLGVRLHKWATVMAPLVVGDVLGLLKRQGSNILLLHIYSASLLKCCQFFNIDFILPISAALLISHFFHHSLVHVPRSEACI